MEFRRTEEQALVLQEGTVAHRRMNIAHVSHLGQAYNAPRITFWDFTWILSCRCGTVSNTF